MNAITPIRPGGEVLAGAFKPMAVNVSTGGPYDGFPCLRLIQLHAEYLASYAVRAEEAFANSNPTRFAKHREDIRERFAKLTAEMADFEARINGDPNPPTEPSSAKAAA